MRREGYLRLEPRRMGPIKDLEPSALDDPRAYVLPHADGTLLARVQKPCSIWKSRSDVPCPPTLHERQIEYYARFL